MPFVKIAPEKKTQIKGAIALVRIMINETKGKKLSPQLLLGDSLTAKFFPEKGNAYAAVYYGTEDKHGYMRVCPTTKDDLGATKVALMHYGGGRLVIKSNTFPCMPERKFDKLPCSEVDIDDEGFTFKLPLEEWAKVVPTTVAPATSEKKIETIPANKSNKTIATKPETIPAIPKPPKEPKLKDTTEVPINIFGKVISHDSFIRPIEYLRKKGFELQRRAAGMWVLHEIEDPTAPGMSLTNEGVAAKINEFRTRMGLSAIDVTCLVDESLDVKAA